MRESGCGSQKSKQESVWALTLTIKWSGNWSVGWSLSNDAIIIALKGHIFITFWGQWCSSETASWAVYMASLHVYWRPPFPEAAGGFIATFVEEVETVTNPVDMFSSSLGISTRDRLWQIDTVNHSCFETFSKKLKHQNLLTPDLAVLCLLCDAQAVVLGSAFCQRLLQGHRVQHETIVKAAGNVVHL